MPNVTSEKPSLPTIWLDTAVVIKIAKIDRGVTVQHADLERITRLKQLLRELVGAGKLLCPQADQEEEYVGGFLDREIHGDFLALSHGISLRQRQGIFDYQAQLGMKCYVERASSIEIPIDAYFHDDPVAELSKARGRSIFIGGHPIRDPEILARRESAKAEVQRVWENLRQEFVKEKRTYDRQLLEEPRGYADAVTFRIEEFEQKIRAGVAPDFWEFMGVEGFLMFQQYWQMLGGNPPGLAGLHQYFCSDYFASLPTPRIRLQLGADLLTGNQVILSGDMMDVDMLSVAIPVSHFVLTDKKMAERIRRHGIDTAWGTKVYSLSDTTALCDQLETLR
jgi:hypothetical protein